MWCHEYFNLNSPPDLVTFSKKMQLGGYYHREDLKYEIFFRNTFQCHICIDYNFIIFFFLFLSFHHRPKQSYRVFNTWMGDPSKLILLEVVLDTIIKEDLLKQVNRVGNYMLKELNTLQNEHSTIMNSVRGRGTFIAFNCETSERRDALIKKLLAKGKNFSILKFNELLM